MIPQKAENVLNFFSEVYYGIDDAFGIGAAVNIIADQHKSVPLRVNIDPGHHRVHFIGASMDIAYGKQLFQEWPSPTGFLIIRASKIVSLLNSRSSSFCYEGV
jgi:hypothetical protein